MFFYNRRNFKFYDFLTLLWEIFLGKLREQMKSEVGNMSEKLEAMRNSITEDGGQFPKKWS